MDWREYFSSIFLEKDLSEAYATKFEENRFVEFPPLKFCFLCIATVLMYILIMINIEKMWPFSQKIKSFLGLIIYCCSIKILYMQVFITSFMNFLMQKMKTNQICVHTVIQQNLNNKYS